MDSSTFGGEVTIGEAVGGAGYNGGFGFAMIVVLFILLIIVGAGFLGY